MIYKCWDILNINNDDINNISNMIYHNSSSLLNAFKLRNKDPENFFDNLIGNMVAYHLHRVGIRAKDFCYSEKYKYEKKPTEFENIHVEYWFKNENDNYVHKDKDEYSEMILNEGTENRPLFTGLLYFTKSKSPTVIYDKDTKDIGIVFPDVMKHIIFDGGHLYHGCKNTFFPNKDERILIGFCAYKKDVLYVPYLDIQMFYQHYYMKSNKNKVNEIPKSCDIIIKNSEITVKNLTVDPSFHSKIIEELHTSIIGNYFHETINTVISDSGSYILTYKQLYLWAQTNGKNDDILLEDEFYGLKYKNCFLERAIIDRCTCDWLCMETKKHVKNTTNEWKTNHHDSYKTHHIPIDELPPILMNYILITFQYKLCDLISDLYKIDMNYFSMNINDAFIVKYSLDTQTKLVQHEDNSCISVILQLNNESEFEGGGTRFLNGLEFNLKQGEAIIFGSKHKHSGIEITYGERMLLVFFIEFNTSL